MGSITILLSAPSKRSLYTPPVAFEQNLGDKQALIAVQKYLDIVVCYVCMRTGGLRSKLVTDSLGWIHRGVYSVVEVSTTFTPSLRCFGNRYTGVL